MPQAIAFAKVQGYNGVRWPKMTDPEGIDSPSLIGPLLIWQQPHPIYYAELVFGQKPTTETLKKFSDIINNTAEFMASFAFWNEDRKCYELGPPLISARKFSGKTYYQNKHPAFELAYWAWGLRKANEWRERMGLERKKDWDNIAGKQSVRQEYHAKDLVSCNGSLGLELNMGVGFPNDSHDCCPLGRAGNRIKCITKRCGQKYLSSEWS